MIVQDNTKNVPLSKLTNEIPKIVNELANRSVSNLIQNNNILYVNSHNRDRLDLLEESKIFEINNDLVSFGNIIGVIKISDEELVINSRFGKNNNYFISYMLEKVLHINITSYLSSYDKKESIFNLIIFLFAEQLIKSGRKGYYKEYVNNYYNDSNIKGKIEVSKHIITNTPFVGDISYSTREYTANNQFNHLIRHTIEFIKNNHRDIFLSLGSNHELINHISVINEITNDYSINERKKIVDYNISHPIIHPYLHEYRVLQSICIMILKNAKQNIDSSKNNASGFIIDVSWLWEEYLNTFLSDYFIHPQNRHKLNKYYLFKEKIGEIYPDFIEKKELDRLILDAKYKPAANIYGDDYKQLLSYMSRFDSKLGIFVYPDLENIVKKLTLNNKNIDSSKQPYVLKYGFPVNSEANEGYSDFAYRMQQQEQLFLKFLKIE